jgi:hypothetical protein
MPAASSVVRFVRSRLCESDDVDMMKKSSGVLNVNKGWIDSAVKCAREFECEWCECGAQNA